MSLTKYLHINLFKQPYRLLPLAVFAFFGLCFVLHPFSPLRTGQLADPDDYMRLNEVINWLQGQSWYDLSMPRMAPGAHTIIHWSRLVDLPIALVMLPFTVFLNLSSAAMIASWIVPLFLFAVMLALTTQLAKPLVGVNRAHLAALLLLFAPAIVFNFTPGRVDHHAYQILIAGFGFVCLNQILSNKIGWRYALAAGLSFACGLWIGTEALPWLLLFLTCLSLLSAWNGGYALRNAALFGGAFAVATMAVLFIALPVSEFSSRALSWFSVADVFLAWLSAAILLSAWLLGRLTKNKNLRVGLVIALGVVGALFFVWLVPDILIGPFADYDTFNSTTALDNINEAQPLSHAFWIDPHNLLTLQRALSAFIHSLFLPLLALAAITYNLTQKKNRERQLWLMQGIFLATATLLTLFWQVRVGYFMELFTLAPLTWLLLRGWEACKRWKERPRFWAEVGVFLALGPLPVLLLPSLFNPATLYRDIILFPAARTASDCNLKPAANFLTTQYGEKNITIMSGMNEGPELLFRTPFNVVGGNYNVSGNPDVLAFFKARDDATAQNILHKWHARLVLTCRNIAPFLAGFDHPQFGQNAFLQPRADGKLHLASSLTSPSLIEKLVNNQPPNWLKPIIIPGSSEYLLFEFEESF